MLSFLKDHPFAVEAFFESSRVMTFALPQENLQSLIPPCLTLDTFQDTYGFIAMAMVQTQSLRPKGFPRILGNDFFLIGYRVFVKYRSATGKIFRGLYILQSETDKPKMKWLGNMFTHYQYHNTDIQLITQGQRCEVRSEQSDFKIVFNESNEQAMLPPQSPFANWSEARKYAGPLPFTFTYKEKSNEVLIIEGVRESWKPQPIEVVDHHISFLDQLQLKNAVLANAFIIKNIPYYWKKGRIEKWKS